MAQLISEVGGYLGGVLGPGKRVLLINPPVQEKRYHWIRWNQPLDLLRLATWIKTRTGTRDVALFDFMLPDERGDVARHKVRDTWTGPQAESLWHFGRPFQDFEEFLEKRMRHGWVPDLILVSSLTSYWHASIEKLLVRLCNVLGPVHRPRTAIALYGAYPRIESEHAETQREADVALTEPIDTSGCAPDLELYLADGGRLPAFFALDIEDGDVLEHLRYCIELRDGLAKRRGLRPSGLVNVTFFNEDLFGPKSQLKRLADGVERYAGRLRVDAICGVTPASASTEALELLASIGTKAMYVEYATKPDGRLDEEAYAPFRDILLRDIHRRRGGDEAELGVRDAMTAFVNIGLPTDDLDAIVRNTLLLNQYFQAIILKPFGYSPDVDAASAAIRRNRWPVPASSSPQLFPYVGHGSSLALSDYDNLMRWQGIVNKRVKSFTFDFLGTGTVPTLVRETLIEESWKRRGEGAA